MTSIMRLYEDTITEFNAAVVRNELAHRISANFKQYFHGAAGPSECRAWQQSLNYLRNSFEDTGLLDDKMIIEYQFPYSSRRIDVLL